VREWKSLAYLLLFPCCVFFKARPFLLTFFAHPSCDTKTIIFWSRASCRPPDNGQVGGGGWSVSAPSFGWPCMEFVFRFSPALFPWTGKAAFNFAAVALNQSLRTGDAYCAWLAGEFGPDDSSFLSQPPPFSSFVRKFQPVSRSCLVMKEK